MTDTSDEQMQVVAEAMQALTQELIATIDAFGSPPNMLIIMGSMSSLLAQLSLFHPEGADNFLDTIMNLAKELRRRIDA